MKAFSSAFLVQAGWLASLIPATRRFEAALHRPERAQLRRLAERLRTDASAAYPRSLGLHPKDSLRDFRRKVPIVGYAELTSWIDDIARGSQQVLSTESVRFFERTSGSSAAAKLIPYTDGLLREYKAATDPWIYRLYRHEPRLWGTKAYWAISPVLREREDAEIALPVGIEDDTEYLGRLGQLAMRQILAVPASVGRLRDHAIWRRKTLLHLLATEDLGFMSVWSPTFLSGLMEHLEMHLTSLLSELSESRKADIERGLARSGDLNASVIWPRLRLISAWSDASSARFVDRMRRFFPGVALQPKGLLSSEGIVSLPLSTPAMSAEFTPRPLAVNSHFLEFLDAGTDSPKVHLAHELVPGGQYLPVMTTAGGLWRYQMNDVVECTGMTSATPTVRFLGRAGQVSDLCGEKLDGRFVSSVLEKLSRVEPMTFSMLAPLPEQRPPVYCLYLESDLDDQRLGWIAAELEEALRDNPHYDHARTLGQIGPVHWLRVHHGLHWYAERLRKSNVRLGDLKPPALQPDWLSLDEDADIKPSSFSRSNR